jgi:hypothetical protein
MYENESFDDDIILLYDDDVCDSFVYWFDAE